MVRQSYPVGAYRDEEALLERITADDVSFEVEKMVAMAVVMALLVLGGLMMALVLWRK